MAVIQQVSPLLASASADKISAGANGTDVSVLLTEGVPIMDLMVDQTKYFSYHHTHADTIDTLSLTDFQQCVAAMAIMAYVLADSPAPLPR